MNWSPSRIAECRKTLEQMEREYAQKEYAKAAESAAFLKAMAGQAETHILMEHGAKPAR